MVIDMNGADKTDNDNAADEEEETEHNYHAGDGWCFVCDHDTSLRR